MPSAEATLSLENPAELVDGVQRYPRTGIDVLVVGAGVGGLMAAIESWRKGHNVRVVERSESLSTIGDYFTITPPALSTLHKYPSMQADYNKEIIDSLITYHSISGHQYFQREPDWKQGEPHAAGDQKIAFLKMRADFAKMQYDQAVRLGIEVFWGRKVTEYEEDTVSGEARVRTQSGETFSADIVIAADGVRTHSHRIVMGQELPSRSSGYAIARVSCPTSVIPADSLAQTLIPKAGERPKFSLYLAEKMHLILFLNHDRFGFAHTHVDTKGKADESWSNFLSPDDVIETISGDIDEWDPAVIALLRAIPKDQKIVDWLLAWRDPQPHWASAGGRIVQLGDSAHAFLPTSGNGATQALEDALSLPECLRLGGKDHAAWSTKAHQLLRFERTSLIQKTGFANRERVHHAYAELEQMEREGASEEQKAARYYRQPAWMWQHKPDEYAAENYWAALNHLKHGTPFENSNIAPGEKYEHWTVDGVLAQERQQRLV